VLWYDSELTLEDGQVASKTKSSGSAKERVASMRAAEKRKERMRWLVTLSVVAVIIAALAGGAVWAVNKSDADKEKKAAKTQAERLRLGPPWSLPADPLAAAKKMGLEVASMEGNVNHFHAHLDLFINGKQVAIPAQLGIGPNALSELHTHDTNGVLHVESSTSHGKRTYTLGQAFQEWEVPLDATTIGQFKTDATHTLKVYVDGKEVTTDPSKVELVSHREIALVYGTANDKVTIPSSYKFAEGE
jgi:hypothetical protein